MLRMEKPSSVIKSLLPDTCLATPESLIWVPEQAALIRSLCMGGLWGWGRHLFFWFGREVQILLCRGLLPRALCVDRGLCGEPGCLASMSLNSDLYPFHKSSSMPSWLSIQTEWMNKQMHCIPGTRWLISCLSFFFWEITAWNRVVTNILPRISCHPLAIVHSLN